MSTVFTSEDLKDAGRNDAPPESGMLRRHCWARAVERRRRMDKIARMIVVWGSCEDTTRGPSSCSLRESFGDADGICPRTVKSAPELPQREPNLPPNPPLLT